MSRRGGLLALGLLWLAVLLLAPLVGSQTVSLGALAAGDPVASAIVWELRLPRVLLGLGSGAVLALAGLALQTLFANPLAEPYTLGVASGAALGASLVFTLAPAAFTGLPMVAAASFAGALAAVGLAVALGRGGSPSRLLLAGVAIALSCQAFILFLQYLSDATETLRMVRWMMGGLGVVGSTEALWVAPFALALAALLALWRWDLDLLLAGEEVAASRGVDVGRRRLVLVGATAVAVAAVVAVAGPIGFVGLMAPHAARRLVGATHGALVPACALGGGLFLVVCDTAGRTLLAPAELPVGVVTALVGGPFFLWLLARRQG